MSGDGVAGCVMCDMSRLRVFGAEGARYTMLGSCLSMVRDDNFAVEAVKVYNHWKVSHADRFTAWEQGESCLVHSFCFK